MTTLYTAADRFDFALAAPGNHTITGTLRADRLNGGAGNDFIFGGSGRTSNAGARSGDDHLDGGAGRDNLYGGDGDDVLIGGPGRDRLHGGEGFDQLYMSGDYAAGGSGSDIYIPKGKGNEITGFDLVRLPHGGGDHIKVVNPLKAFFTDIVVNRFGDGLLDVNRATLHDGGNVTRIKFSGAHDVVVDSLAEVTPQDFWPAIL